MRFSFDVNGASPKELRDLSRLFVAFASSRGSKPWAGSLFRLADQLSEAAGKAMAEPRP